MKLKVVISGLLLAVYSLIFAHSIIPHGHYTHNRFVEFRQDDTRDNDHDDHRHFPHHDQSQHVGGYIFTAKNPLPQLAFQSIACNEIPLFAFSPVVRAIQKQDFYFVPPKIPNQFVKAVPLRAPPAC